MVYQEECHAYDSIAEHMDMGGSHRVCVRHGMGAVYPAKPVRVVVVFPAGGATDVVARFVFQKVGEQLNQQFLIDNRAGAGGTIGAAIVAKSPPDGYTLMVYSQTLLANAHLYESCRMTR